MSRQEVFDAIADVAEGFCHHYDQAAVGDPTQLRQHRILAGMLALLEHLPDGHQNWFVVGRPLRHALMLDVVVAGGRSSARPSERQSMRLGSRPELDR